MLLLASLGVSLGGAVGNVARESRRIGIFELRGHQLTINGNLSHFTQTEKQIL